MAKFYKNTTQNVKKIYRVLREERDPLTVGEIARRANLHKWVVSRTLDVWMHPFVEMTIVEELEMVGLKMKLVRLKDAYTEEQVVKGLALL